MRIALERVTKRFASLKALENISLTIEPGQIVAVLGANGAGKTTLLRCLASILAPDSGRIFFDGEIFNRGRVDLRRKLCFLPDFPLMFPNLPIAKHIAMVLRLYGIEGTDVAPVAAKHLHELDLLPLIDTPVGRLSRGQLYKTALATLLTINPELWLLDEPFASGMDPVGISYLKQEAEAAAKKGKTILYSTQILDVAEKFCDRVCLIHRGKLRVFDALRNIQTKAHSDNVLEDVFQQLREEDK
jgi:ABC-type multidrug transport system ATPase subunit